MSTYSILIVDDNNDLADAMADVLQLDGHVTKVCYNGEDGIQALLENRFDLVFLDVKLPGKNGIEIRYEIMKRIPNQKIVTMTAFRTSELLAEIAGDDKILVIDGNHENLDLKRLPILAISHSITVVNSKTPINWDSLTQLCGANSISYQFWDDNRSRENPATINHTQLVIIKSESTFIDKLSVYYQLKEMSISTSLLIIQDIDANDDTLEGYLKKPFDLISVIDVVNRLGDKKEKP